MNPQNNIYYNNDFQVPGSINRSPGTSRPYGTISNPQGGRRGLDSLSQPFQTPLQYGDDNRIQYERYDRGLPQNSYMVDNSQAWGYNVATVNGAMNGANRYRQNARRAAIPTAWTQDVQQASLPPPQVFQSPMIGGTPGLNGHNPHLDPFVGSMMRDDKDQIIPTAIVIKNIPFSVRKEQLAGLMAEMNLPQPYAFNYHFDAGIFRGLAFANFQTPEETKLVIDAMNQMDVNGRKLRVEYKKMLPEHERERIEREKREKRGQLQEQHQPIAVHQQPSIPQLNTSISSASVSKSSAGPLRDVDLNNPDTLSFYTELTLFKSDATREVLIFPPTITPEQRRQIHILAHNLSLEHQSIGDGENRQLQVFKRNQISPVSTLPNVSYDHNRRGLSRAATIDFAESRIASTGFHPMSRPGPMLELPGSPDVNGTTLSNLRAAKSFADLRSYSPSPAPSQSSIPPNPAISTSTLPIARYGEYGGSLNTPNLTPSTPGANAPMSTPGTSADSSVLASTMANMTIGGAAFDRPRDNPGTIGSQRPGPNGTTKSSRLPGSDWDAAAFAGRRANGHMQRGSDSSDNTRDGRSGGSRLY